MKECEGIINQLHEKEFMKEQEVINLTDRLEEVKQQMEDKESKLSE